MTSRITHRVLKDFILWITRVLCLRCKSAVIGRDSHRSCFVCRSVRRDQAGFVHEAGELAQRAGDVLHTQRPGQNARREQNRQGV